MAPPTIVHQRVAIGMKVFDEIADVAAGSDRVAHLADMNRVKPTRQIRQAPKAGTRTAMPKRSGANFWNQRNETLGNITRLMRREQHSRFLVPCCL